MKDAYGENRKIMEIAQKCDVLASDLDIDDIYHFIERYQKENKKSIIYGLIGTEIFFFIILSFIFQKIDFSIIFSAYAFFLLPIIMFAFIGIIGIMNDIFLKRFVKDNSCGDEKNIKVSSKTYILREIKVINMSNTMNAKKVTRFIFKEEGTSRDDEMLVAKGIPNVVWDEMKEETRYRFYFVGNKKVLCIKSDL